MPDRLGLVPMATQDTVYYNSTFGPIVNGTDKHQSTLDLVYFLSLLTRLGVYTGDCASLHLEPNYYPMFFFPGFINWIMRHTKGLTYDIHPRETK